MQGGGYPHFPTRDTFLPALPTQQFNAFKDYEAWDLHREYHHILVGGDTSADDVAAFTPGTDTSANAVLAPGTWYIGVANTAQTVLSSFLTRYAR